MGESGCRTGEVTVTCPECSGDGLVEVDGGRGGTNLGTCDRCNGTRTVSRPIDKGAAVRKLAMTLRDRGVMIASRIGEDGRVLGRQGLAADIAWAREILNEIERSLDSGSPNHG